MTSQPLSESSLESGTESAFRIRVPVVGVEQDVDWTAVLDAIPNILGVYDSELRLRYLNKAGRELFGRGLDEIVGKSDAELLGTEATSAHRALLESAAQSLQTTTSARPTIIGGRTNEENGLCGITYAPVRDNADRVIAFVGITNILYVDCPTREASYFKALDEVESLAVTVVALDGRITSWSQGCERLFGYSAHEAVGTNFSVLLAKEEDEMACLRARLAHSRTIETEARTRHADGRTIDVALSASAIRDPGGALVEMTLVIRDVTLARATRNRLHAAKQVEQMASTAAGMAHDINSILTIVGCFSRFVAEGVLTAKQQEDLSVAVEASSRAAVLATQMLSLYGKRSPVTTIVDVNDAVEAIVSIVRRMLKSGVALTTRLPAVPLKIRGSADQVDRILLNLIMNARDAMPDGGILTVGARKVRVEPGHDVHGQVRDGDYAVVVIQDTGVGMDALTRSRIFEASFTTKTDEGGSGLGLTVVQEIVRDLRGTLRVESEKGWGTSFSVYLPLLPESTLCNATAVQSPAPLPHGQQPPIKRAGGLLRPSVLVVDEDQSLCESLVRLLAKNDIDAVAALGASSALQTMRTHAIDVLVTEQFLSGMDGIELLEATRETFPEITNVLFTSEASPDIVVAAVNKGRVAKILLKNMQPLAICDEITRLAWEAIRRS